MPKAFARDLGQSAFGAFHSDMPIGGRGSEVTAQHNDVIVVATLLRHATVMPRTRASKRLIREASRIAKRAIGKRPTWKPYLADGPSDVSPLDVFRMLGEICSARGQMHLHDQLLESVEQLAIPGSLTQGRVAFRRALLLFDLGEARASEMKVDSLLENRQWKKYDELRLRGWGMRYTFAYARGNLPEAERYALRLVRAAGDRFPVHKGIGCNAVGALAAQRKDFNRALLYTWKAYALHTPTPSVHLQAVVNNMAQILLDAGHPAAARAGFARLLAEPVEFRVLYTAISGYAMASAALGDATAVGWASAQVLRLARERNSPSLLARALLECSEALAIVGEHVRAGTFRRRALRLAEQHGYHRLIFEAQQTMTVISPASHLTRSAEAVAARVTEMEPERMPAVLVYAD
jgi:hypothetical protein